MITVRCSKIHLTHRPPFHSSQFHSGLLPGIFFSTNYPWIEDEEGDEEKLPQGETISAAPLAGHPLTVNLGERAAICWATVNKHFGGRSTNNLVRNISPKIWQL